MYMNLAASLSILGFVGAIIIDNELRVIKIDCYERIAIGQRLNSSNVYKIYKYNTVGDCKRICSDEKGACKAFSFGISAKGNGTCELGSSIIKETGDFKPTGTVSDVDFDSYIKKTGCTVVSEKYPHRKQPANQFTVPNTLGNVPDEERVHNDIQNVQTVVSVASGPQTVLNPIHGIIVSSDKNKNHYFGTTTDWYKGLQVYPQAIDSYNFRYNSYSDNIGYGNPSNIPYEEIRRYDNEHHIRRKSDIYANEPKSDYRRYPMPEKYGSMIPHPDYYYERPTYQDYPYPFFKPSSRPNTVEYQYNRPQETKPVYEIESSNKPISDKNPTKNSASNSNASKKPIWNNSKPIVTHSTGYNGEQITSIITEIKDVRRRHLQKTII